MLLFEGKMEEYCLLRVGDNFSSFEQFNEKLEEYMQKTFTQFWRRDARTVEAAKKRVNRQLSADIKYYDVRYCCINGGLDFKSRGKGERQTSTFKQGCKAFIHAGASDDGQSLVVKKICDEHNHEVKQELFRHLTQQRKLDEPTRADAVRLLQLKANKKMVRQHVVGSTGKIFTVKDMANLSAASTVDKSNDLRQTVEQLTNKYGILFTVAVNS